MENYLQFHWVEDKGQRFLAEEIFIEKKPRSRVALDIVKQLRKRIDQLAGFEHENYLQFTEVREVNGEYCLLSAEHVKTVPLWVYLEDNKLSISKAVDWMEQTVAVMSELVKKDEKISGLNMNTLRVDEYGKIKIVDPEIIKITGKYQKEPQAIMLDNFIPPEIIEQNEWNDKSRLYTIGIILYYLTTCQAPFSGSDKTEILDKILSSSWVEPRFLNYEISIELNSLIKALMARQPAARPDGFELVLNQLNTLKKNDNLQASSQQQKENAARSKRVLRSSYIKQNAQLFFKRYWKVATVVVVVAAFLAVGIFTGGHVPTVTDQFTPEDVVKVFYNSINEKDVTTLGEATTVDLGYLDRMVSTSYVIEKMQSAYGQQALNGQKKDDLKQEIFGVQDLQIENVKTGTRPVFITNYSFFTRGPEGLKKYKMQDKVTLEQTKGIWQIVELDGDIQKLMHGGMEEK